MDWKITVLILAVSFVLFVVGYTLYRKAKAISPSGSAASGSATTPSSPTTHAVRKNGWMSKTGNVVRDYSHGPLAFLSTVVFYALIAATAYQALYWSQAGVEYALSFLLGYVGLPEFVITYKQVASLTWAVFAVFLAGKHTISWFVISVPEFVGVLTVNLIGGQFHKYGQGFHFKSPFEQVKKELCFKLESVTVDLVEDYVTKDGAVAQIKGSFRYAPSFERLEDYADKDEQSIGISIVNIAKSHLTIELSIRTATEARRQTDQIKKKIDDLYRNTVESIEEDLGIDFEDFTIADIGFDQRSQNALATAFESSVIFEGATTPQDREDRLVLAGKVKRELTQFELRGGVKVEGLEGVASALVPFAPQIAKALALKGKQGGGQGQGKQGQQGQKPSNP